MYAGRAQGGGEGGGGRPRWTEGRPDWEVLQPNPDDRKGAAAAY